MRKNISNLPDFTLEAELIAQGVAPIAGVDEVGRGPLAGPVCAAAVILDAGEDSAGLGRFENPQRDRAREGLRRDRRKRARDRRGLRDGEEIDATNIRKAALKAMAQAVAALSVAPAFVLVDGRDLPQLPCPGRAIVKGDGLSQSIAAASIVAKVARDAMMRDIARAHGEYGFSTNMGYGSATHLAALARHGPTRFHRLSFAPCKPRIENS